MKYATFLLAITIITILVIANNSSKGRMPHNLDPQYTEAEMRLMEAEYVRQKISDRQKIREMMEIEIVPMGTIPSDIDLDEWVHEIEYEIMSERCDDILQTTQEIKKLVETKHGSATKK